MVRDVDRRRPSTKVRAAEDLPNIAATRDVEQAQLKRARRGDLDWISDEGTARRTDPSVTRLRTGSRRRLRHLRTSRWWLPVQRDLPAAKVVRKHCGAVIAASLVVVSRPGSGFQRRRCKPGQHEAGGVAAEGDRRQERNRRPRTI